MEKSVNWKVLLVCLAIVYFVAFIGSLFTNSAVKSAWYEQIKPGITPPNWVFPVVWNILFFLIALSLYFVWTSRKNKNKKLTAVVYLLNFNFNMLWSLLYFGLRNPLSAFYQIIVLWLSILLMIVYTWRIDRKAGYLLILYLLWVSFASILNYLSI